MPGARPRTLPFAVLLVASAALLGCGDSNDGETTTAVTASPEPLTAPERATIRRMEDRVQGFCRDVAQSLAAEGPAPTKAQLSVAIKAIDEAGALARRKPEAPLPSGGDVRLALGDVAENLEGTNCSPSLVEHIDQTLATLP